MDSRTNIAPPLSVGKRVEVGIDEPGHQTQWLPTRIEDEDGSGQQPAQSEQIVQFIFAQQRAVARNFKK